ncbi:unnamed protein product [Rotaria sp. Silwood2]|nr:unnamed protein product [Rotaria sp. Silwood2]
MNPSNIRVGSHENFLLSNKETIQFLTNEINLFNLELLLSPNDCCQNYADIVIYDQNGNKVNCMEFQESGFSKLID